MSTKTTFKRIALVAVASLGAGALSVAPANAAVSTAFNFVTAESFSNTTDTAVHVAGLSNYVEIASVVDTAGVTRVSVSGASATFIDITEAVAKVEGSSGSSNGTNPAATWSYNTGATVATSTDGDIFGAAGTDADDVAGYQKLRIATPVAGTVTIKVDTVTVSNGLETVTDAGTLTVTVNAAATSGTLSVANSTSLVDKDATAAGSYSAPTADEAVSVAKAASTAAGVAKLTLNDVNSVAMPNTTSVTAVVTGPGIVSLNSTLSSATYANGGRVDSGTTASGVIYAAFYADGNSGVSTITFSVGTTVVATETVTFYGAATKLTATPVKYSLADDASATAFVSISASDANGVAVPIAAADGAPTTTNGVFTDADGATAFSVSVLLDPAADTLGTKSTTWTHTATALTIDVSVVVAEALATGTQVTTMTVDKAEYSAGEKITVTVKSVDASGNIMADGAGNYFTSANVTSTAALQGTLPAQSVTLANGVATYTLYAPLVSGPVTLSGTSAATAAQVVTATFTVLSDGVAQAAVDAAAEATDAANAATDAANAAAEAADAATAAAQDAADAVAALSTQVTELVTALRKQITALTNLVIKIQKKVKA